MVWNIRREETSHLIFSIAGSPPESPSANPPGAGTIGFETEYQVGHYVPPDIFIGVSASLLLRACYPRPCLVLSDISRREPLETAASLYTKPLEDDPVPGDYTIFMAQSRRVGKDSKGEPVFALDEKGSATSELDEDLTQIAEAYKTFRDIGTFTESETCFTAERGELDDNLNLNPQHYSPELNATLEKVSKFDDKPDWSVTTIGQLDKNIRIYMGPRWSSRSLVVEDPSDTTNLTPYLTANGALEQRRMTVKWFDMSRATDKQKECVRMLRVQKGDILISRSGTIGKVTYATRILADKYVISDDLVRVRVPDENMRAYLLAFLMSSTAMNLMKLDEFGSVQQHLQPRHIWGLPVPVPDSWEQVSPIIDAGKGMISAMEQTSLADESLRTNGFDSLIE